jgi:hypothetical protein
VQKDGQCLFCDEFLTAFSGLLWDMNADGDHDLLFSRCLQIFMDRFHDEMFFFNMEIIGPNQSN